MSIRGVVGMQWGDEGKGKLVDVLSSEADVVVRYQGGANAGHTLIIEGQRFVSHLVPCGIMHPGVLCVVGNGVVIDPAVMLDEIDELARIGVSVGGRLKISDRAHVVLPYHKVRERVGGGMDRIGTTGRGIGPCYADKVRRSGVRICDLYEPNHLAELITRGVNATEDPDGELDARAIIDQYTEFARQLQPYVTDTVELIHTAVADGKNVLIEGAQGTLLDIDFGTYPYVTSSNCSSCGISAGAGISPRLVEEVIGISKAYTTRVGAGPFPTELTEEVGARLAERGNEFGATTGRPRRCGWLDLVALRYATRLNGVDHIALTKLDVLSGLEEIKVATHYEIDGERTDAFPASIARLERAVPVYETFPGWSEEIDGCTARADLPQTTRAYIAHLEERLGVPMSWISVGPERAATLAP